MSDTPVTPPSEHLAAQLTQAEAAVQQTQVAREQAVADARQVQTARAAIDEHSKAIAALKGQAESDAGWFTTTKQGIDQAQATIAQVRAEAESAKTAVGEAVAAIEQARGAAKVASEGTEAFRAQAEKLAADATAHQKSTITSSTTAGTAREAAAKAAAQVQEALESVTTLHAKVGEESTKATELGAEIAKAHADAQALVKSMTAADNKAKHALAIIENHEKELDRLKRECDALHSRIESLLPNATSAGLATAFREQKSRFEKPQLMWLATFVATILGLLVSSLWGIPGGASWDAMGKHFVIRLPIIAPLVWLAIYAGRHYGLALRLQEEYAYKEAVSAAFEGYKREMNAVAASADGRSPLVTLCENVLNTLGQRPGRIYEGKHDDITPLNTVANVVKDAAVAAKEAVQIATTAAKS